MSLATLVTGVAVVHQHQPATPPRAAYAATASTLDELALLPRPTAPPRASRERVVARHVTAPAAVHTHAARPSKASSKRYAPSHAASEKIMSRGFTYTQLRIRSCESGPNGYATGGRALDYNYTEQNAHSTASGAWQFLDSTWDNFRGYRRAMYAPPAVQDEKARLTFAADGNVPWYASRSCWGS